MGKGLDQEEQEVFAVALEDKPEQEQMEPEALRIPVEPEEKLVLEGIEKEPYQELERKLGLERLEKGPEQQLEVFAVALEDKPEQECLEQVLEELDVLGVRAEPEEKLAQEGMEKEPSQERLERKLGLERLAKGPEQEGPEVLGQEDKPEQEQVEPEVLGVRTEPEEKLALEGIEKESSQV
jgi:hypothetical protein